MRLKGQITIYLFISLLIDMVVLAVLLPLYTSIVNLMIAGIDPSDTVSILLAQMLIPFLFFGLIFGILFYVNPMRSTQ
jgi:hypothetical protein